MTEPGTTPPQGDAPPPTVGELATLYLGNLLFALERTALGFEGEGKSEEAAFYRALGRQLADAHGRSRPAR